jgi:hypothetical protein
MKTKNIIKTIVLCGSIALFATSCRKHCEQQNQPADTASQTAAIQAMRTSFNNATTYNDSLNYWYNMGATLYGSMMHRCDSVYHQCNNIMMSNYNYMNSTGGMMNGNGGTMNGNGGMMGGSGGMMGGGNNTSMNCTINGNSCTTMIASLHNQHIHCTH